MRIRSFALGVMMLVTHNSHMATANDFTKGPLITEYGPVVIVDGAAPLPADTGFSVAFDVTARGADGALNRKFESAARFLNMHAAVGVKADNMRLAVVVHGPAVFDLTNAARFGAANPNADMIKTLEGHGVRFIVCGQSAAFQDVGVEDLLPGVELAVSAMTAHALLQQGGYTLNPF